MTFKKQLLPDLVVVADSDGRVSGDGREECRRDRLAVAGQRANGRQRLRVGPENELNKVFLYWNLKTWWT